MEPLILRLGLALAIGLLVGLERGWRERDAPEGSRTAGIRTFGISGLLGGIVAAVSEAQQNQFVFAAGLLGFSTSLTWFKLREARREDIRRIVEMLADDEVARGREDFSGDMAAYEAAFDAIAADAGVDLVGRLVGARPAEVGEPAELLQDRGRDLLEEGEVGQVAVEGQTVALLEQRRLLARQGAAELDDLPRPLPLRRREDEARGKPRLARQGIELDGSETDGWGGRRGALGLRGQPAG